MIKSVLDYLEAAARRCPDKVGYVDENRSMTFGELYKEARTIGSGLLPYTHFQPGGVTEPVLVFMEKSVECIAAFLGIRYAGGFYVPLDVETPDARLAHIVETCRAHLVITRRGMEVPACLQEKCTVLVYEDLAEKSAVDDNALRYNRRFQIDTDPAYAIFTSGSTGIPKGVLVSERSLLNFTEWYCEFMDFAEDEVFANQAPFYFDASDKDIYATLKLSATMYIVPRKLFSLPKQLVSYLNDNRITAIVWVPSVLCMITKFHTFDKIRPQYLRKVMFMGEVMPTRQFNLWRKALPDVQFANLYGPTEATSDCCGYRIEQDFSDDEPIPIGYPCDNTEVFLLGRDGQIVRDDHSEGEICVRGCSLALGYYNAPEKTAAAFTKNPFQSAYQERIYHTGDIGKYNRFGEIVFVERKDSQIKHMGHRIELGEIETAVNAIDGISRAVCMYRHSDSRIVLVYEGSLDSRQIIEQLRLKVPRYMLPNQIIQLDALPLNPNGKIDRAALKAEYITDQD